MSLQSVWKAAMICSLMSFVPQVARSESLLAITNVAGVPVLVGFESQNPLLPKSLVVVTGLARGQQLVGLDARPLNGKIYGLATTPGTSNSRSSLYEINSTTGKATVVIGQLSTDLEKEFGAETKFGFDFNPQIDRIRVVSELDQNLVLDPNGGTTTVATDLFYGPGDVNQGANPNVTHIAYDQNTAGTTATQLRAIDTDLDTVAKLANSAGVLTTVGPLGIEVEDIGGFDVSATGSAFAIMTEEGAFLQRLYTINLQTGAATSIGFPGLGILRLDGLTAVPAQATATSSQGR